MFVHNSSGQHARVNFTDRPHEFEFNSHKVWEAIQLVFVGVIIFVVGGGLIAVISTGF